MIVEGSERGGEDGRDRTYLAQVGHVDGRWITRNTYIA